MPKIAINRCHGGFGLSDAAYEKLIEYGVPVRAYKEQVRDPVTGLFLPEPNNGGEIIFDTSLTTADKMHSLLGQRYWDSWTRSSRTHALVIRAIEELGTKEASGRYAELAIVEVPDDVDWEIDEYDGSETVREKSRSWY